MVNIKDLHLFAFKTKTESCALSYIYTVFLMGCLKLMENSNRASNGIKIDEL